MQTLTMTRPQAPLTPGRYAERKADLEKQLEAAKQWHAETAYRLELGEVDESALDRTRVAIANLEARLAGLAKVFGEAREADERAAVEADAQARREAVAAVEVQLKVRADALKAIEKMISRLGAHVQVYDDASNAITHAIRPFRADIGDAVNQGELGRSIADRGGERKLVEGMLFGQFLQDGRADRSWGVGTHEAWFAYRDGGVAHHNEFRSRDILRAVQAILPYEGES